MNSAKNLKIAKSDGWKYITTACIAYAARISAEKDAEIARLREALSHNDQVSQSLEAAQLKESALNPKP